MTKFGNNMKLSVAAEHRAALHAVMTDVLKCEAKSPMEHLSLYVFADGFNVGVYWVPAEKALSERGLRTRPMARAAGARRVGRGVRT